MTVPARHSLLPFLLGISLLGLHELALDRRAREVERRKQDRSASYTPLEAPLLREWSGHKRGLYFSSSPRRHPAQCGFELGGRATTLAGLFRSGAANPEGLSSDLKVKQGGDRCTFVPDI